MCALNDTREALRLSDSCPVGLDDGSDDSGGEEGRPKHGRPDNSPLQPSTEIFDPKLEPKPMYPQ